MAGRRAPERCTREELHSPGRPPAWLLEHHRRFLESIARVRTSEEATGAHRKHPPSEAEDQYYDAPDNGDMSAGLAIQPLRHTRRGSRP